MVYFLQQITPYILVHHSLFTLSIRTYSTKRTYIQLARLFPPVKGRTMQELLLLQLQIQYLFPLSLCAVRGKKYTQMVNTSTNDTPPQ